MAVRNANIMAARAVADAIRTVSYYKKDEHSIPSANTSSIVAWSAGHGQDDTNGEG